MPGDPQAGQFHPIGFSDPERAGAKAPRVGIVEDDDAIVSGQPQVALDAGAELDRRVKRVKAVFRNGRAKVQAAVSETVWARIERISP